MIHQFVHTKFSYDHFAKSLKIVKSFIFFKTWIKLISSHAICHTEVFPKWLSLNSVNSLTNLCKKWVSNPQPPHKRQTWYHSTMKTRVIEKLFKLTPNSCFSDLLDSLNLLNSLNSVNVQLHLRKTTLF